MEKVFTKGDVVVNEIKVGDIHYEYDYGCHVKVEVLTMPEKDDDGYWTWKAKNLKSGIIINYGVNEKYAHYGPKLYTYEAYLGSRQI